MIRQEVRRGEHLNNLSPQAFSDTEKKAQTRYGEKALQRLKQMDGKEHQLSHFKLDVAE